MDGWNTSFLLGWPTFRGHVSFRECKFSSYFQPIWVSFAHLGAHRFHFLNAPFKCVVKSVSGSLSRHVWPGGRHDS